jgi:hypothetical protein
MGILFQLMAELLEVLGAGVVRAQTEHQNLVEPVLLDKVMLVEMDTQPLLLGAEAAAEAELELLVKMEVLGQLRLVVTVGRAYQTLYLALQ